MKTLPISALPIHKVLPEIPSDSLLNSSNESLANLLRRVSEATELSFRRVNNIIHVAKKKNLDPLIKEIITYDREISGKVTDENGSGLPGVNVLIKDTDIGTITDTDGNYKLAIPDEARVLVFSYVGYISEEVEIAGRSVVDLSTHAGYCRTYRDSGNRLWYAAEEGCDWIHCFCGGKSNRFKTHHFSRGSYTMTYTWIEYSTASYFSW